MNLRHSIVWIALFLALLCTAVLKAQDGLRGALSRVAQTAHAVAELSTQIAAADFDNDQKPDGAILVETGLLNGERAFRIELHVTGNNSNAITFSSPESGLTLSALDVNQDGIPDLIVEQVFTGKRLQVWLNDGHGRFRQARPEDFPAPSDAPFRWHALFAGQASLAIGLPSRFEDHQTVRLVEVLRFDSSSSRWRVLPELLDAPESKVTRLSPRAPPAILPL